MLGAAADRNADQVAFDDALLEQVIRQAIGALVQFRRLPLDMHRQWRACRDHAGHYAEGIRRYS